MQIIMGDKHKRRGPSGGGIINIGGPKESYIGSGPGINDVIGPNANQMVRTMMHPDFIEEAFGEGMLEVAALKRKYLAENGRGEGHAVGMTKGGEMQYIGAMDSRLFATLMWTDPSLFEGDGSRLEEYLNRAGLGIKTPKY